MLELIFGLALLGTVLIVAEFFLPGMVAGICGGIALGAAIVLVYANYGLDKGNVVMAVVTLIALALFVGWMRAFSGGRIGRHWTLQETVPADGTSDRLRPLQNQTGKALTALRPAGTALIEGHRIDVIAESGVIEPGATVRVIRVEGPKVVVRAA
jgi:membrane-bound serine protease (ClpP class)